MTDTKQPEALREALDELGSCQDDYNYLLGITGDKDNLHGWLRMRAARVARIRAALAASKPEPSGELADLINRLRSLASEPYRFDGHNEIGVALLQAAALLAADKAGGDVYPADGTTAPFTVINLGHGKVQMGDCIHDDRLPALWFGKDGKGMGHIEELNRRANEGETLAVVTFSNMAGLDVLLDVVYRIRDKAFPDAKQYPHPQPSALPDDVVKDAERYRWLRNGDYPFSFAQRVLNDTPFGIDAAIDAAMLKEVGK